MDDFGIAALDTPPTEPRVYTPRDDWERRRMEAFGASDMPMVLAIAGMHPIEALPKYMQELSLPLRQVLKRIPAGVAPFADEPRLFLEKAGLMKATKPGRSAMIGIEREEELLRAWVTRLVTLEYACEEEQAIDVATIRHASKMPREYTPLRASRGRVAVSPDGWGRFTDSRLFDVECKCTGDDVHDVRWAWNVQVQTQGLATHSVGAFVVAGCRWTRIPRDDGPIVRAFVPPDHGLRNQIIEASASQWERVEALKERTKEVQT